MQPRAIARRRAQSASVSVIDVFYQARESINHDPGWCRAVVPGV